MPVNTESNRRQDKQVVGKPVNPDQLQKPAQTGQEHQGEGHAGYNRISLSPPPTRWTTVFIRGLELLRWSLLLFYRYLQSMKYVFDWS